MTRRKKIKIEEVWKNKEDKESCSLSRKVIVPD